MQASSNGTGLDLLNLSVSGASLEDLVAIWELSSKKFDPKYVFFGADPWIFNLNSGQNRWTSLSEEYSLALDRLGISKEVNYSSAQPDSYFNKIAVGLYDSLNLSKIKAEDDTPSATDKIRKDGSRVYNLSYANKSSSEVDRGSQSYISYAMGNYTYSNEVRTILEKFASELKRQDKKVVFVLSPYHPKLFDLMRLEDRKFLEIESKFREIAESSGAEVIGSYDPVKVGCASNDFYDGMHPKDKCVDKIFSSLSK